MSPVRIRKGTLLGYFFGPKRAVVPSIDDLADLKAEGAVLVGRFGYLGLKHGTWPVIGRLEDWDRTEWPMPVFVRYEELTGRSLSVFYDDGDPARVVREDQVAPGLDEQGPKDGLMGAGYVEIVLTDWLR